MPSQSVTMPSQSVNVDEGWKLKSNNHKGVSFPIVVDSFSHVVSSESCCE